jgi:hypothetical protein
MEWEDELRTYGGRVLEGYETVGEFRVLLDSPPIWVNIRVEKDLTGMYWGICNYQIQNPDQASPYFDLHQYETPEQAFRMALSGLLMYWLDDPEKQKRTKLIPNDFYYRLVREVTGSDMLD